MFTTMLRRLVRKPLSLAIVGVLAGIPVVGGAAMLVSEDFRGEVQARVADALPGLTVGGCDLSQVPVQCPNANLKGARLVGTTLTGANLRGANMMFADVHLANLKNADLSGVNLTYADLTGANLTGANLSGADLTGSAFCYTAMPDGSRKNDRCP